jgi:hypothetical protein
MNLSVFLVSFAALAAIVEEPTQQQKSKATREIENLIGQIKDISQIGSGYSSVSTGHEFLPQPDSKETPAFLFSNIQEKSSPVLRAIVEKGLPAVPLLIDRLGDERKTGIPPVSPLMWMSFAEEYDFNRRTRLKAPEGVNRDTFGEDQPQKHQITVGDLCFVALGQIVNRNFCCCRYQPSGGLVINSPTYSKHLRDQVSADFKGLTEEMHKKSLKEDFMRPDHEYRRIGAYRRLAFYYPSEVEDLVLKQLAIPTYDVFAAEAFVRNRLYAEKSKERRKELLSAFVQKNGPGSSDGVLMELFEDLDTQEADEENRHFPRGYPGDPRALLIELYDYKKSVKSTEKPFVESWARTEMARFVKSLLHDKSEKIDKKVFEVFNGVEDDDYLALACIARLVGRGYEKEMRAYCERRIGKDKYHQDELKGVLKRLQSRTDR